ncbi:hypothetical protein RSOLAG1IB_09715 [Rhizoctonia solani AG-1 IB]|uniref:Uncharacterized protein n=1 Tax=Thanatephorus cucumeris (strain AG1-IB / isolate 7/3/14) TaxID=1108050 RepID=A0A0B7FWC0_THACB|nr:hypothetical protein RSOLAG1IB_09715 [Rhizoctonia solani AG-1 IB]
MATFLFYGIADVAIGFALMFKPNVIYQSGFTRFVHHKTGLHMTDVNSAPGFNNALACMTIAVGAGSIRAGLTNSRGAQSCITLISMVWAVMTLASCIVNPQVASATHAMTAFNHFVISGVLLWNGGVSIPELVGLGKQSATRNPRPRQSIGGRR